MIDKDYGYVNSPNGFRLLKEGELIKRGDIYYAEINNINTNNILTWRECKISLGRKFYSKRFMPVARRV